ncbi:MAG TPA: methylated-DNA--[protein]-cysteine S-methyltransferase [Gaiellaceae bacterium]|jgi:methylated-DNA-[protein]-cysteine S-methyltransferase|nr:methylated-DNA--[protein]-cysteine S-methyltransferase [Gaiellaceae bacterium]
MRPTLLQYEAPGFGIGEVWLDPAGRVFHSELPRPRRLSRVGASSDAAQTLCRRLQRFFHGEDEAFLDVPLVLPDGFHGECARVLRAVPRGQVVTYGELAALAGRPRAARAAGTFCARCDLAPFLPVHRVVSAGGIGSWGDLGVEYKRRLLELEGVAL